MSKTNKRSPRAEALGGGNGKRKPKAAPVSSLTDASAIIQATVRRSDESSGTRPAMYRFRELCARQNVKWVKVANGRVSAAVASLAVRVYRTTDVGKSAFDTKRLSDKATKSLCARGGHYVRKAIDKGGDGDMAEVEAVTDPRHPLVAFLTTFNDQMAFYEALELTQMYLGLAGNSYWAIVNGPSGWPIEGWVLPPQFVEVLPDRETWVGGYIYGRGTENEKYFPPTDIIHFKNPNPTGDPFYGLGDLSACVDDADLAVIFTKLCLAMLDNGAQPGVIVTGKAMTENQREAAELVLNRKHSGVGNAGRSLVLRGDLTVSPFSSESEMKFLLGAQQVKEAIANCFDLPLALLTLESAALATAAVAVAHWMRMGVQPRAKRLADRMNSQLVTRFRAAMNDPGLFVAFDSAIDEDEAQLITNEVALVGGRPIKTQNEARAVFGLEPAEGGDDLNAAPLPGAGLLDLPGIDGEADQSQADVGHGDNAQAAAAGDVQATALNGAQVAALVDLAVQVAAGKLPNASAQAIALAAFPLVPSETITGIFTPLDSFEPTPDAPPPTATPTPAPDKEPPRAPGSKRRKPVGDRERAAGGTEGERAGAAGTAAAGAVAAGAAEPAAKAVSLLQSDVYLGHADACCGEAARKSGVFRLRLTAEKDRKPDGTPTFAEQLQAFFGRVQTAAVANVTAHGVLFPADQLKRELEGIAGTFLPEDFAAGYDAAAKGEVAAANLSPFSVQNKPAMAYLDTHKVQLADSVVGTVDARIKAEFEAGVDAALKEGLTVGESIPQITKRIQEAVAPMKDYAAERIARTETSRAYNGGRVQAWEESGLVEGKEWLLSSDPCPYCLAMAEQFKVVSLRSNFLNAGASLTTKTGSVLTADFGAIESPPCHPNCQCSMGLVMKKAIAA